jgi:glycosyltransferase involved in cell wall biosynthesis
MRVAFIFLHPFAGSLGSTIRLRELATHLTKYDVESIIYTPYEKNHVISQGVTVVSVGGTLHKLGLAAYVYRFSKFAYYNQFFIKHFLTSNKMQTKLAKNNASPIIKALKQSDVQVIQVEQDFAIPTAIEVKKKSGLPLIVDLHNITSEELVASGAIKRDSDEFHKLQEMLKNNLAQVNEVIVVSSSMKDYVLTNYAIPPEHVHIVPPGGNSRELKQKVTTHPKVVYSGMVAYREHVDLFVKSMPFIKEKIKDVEFYITNKGEDLKKIKRLAKELHVNPIFFWYPKKEDFIDFLSSCDIAVLPSSNDLAREMGTPAKLFDYLSVGLPVVANNVGDWSSIIDSEKVGILTKDNPHDFAEDIINLINNPYNRDNFSKNALNLVKERYSWDSSSKALSQTFKKITTNNLNKR